jgi:hypothetical protein
VGSSSKVGGEKVGAEGGVVEVLFVADEGGRVGEVVDTVAGLWGA